MPGEVPFSLQARLARANHLNPGDLDALLAFAQRGKRTRMPTDLSGLAALSGYPAGALARVLGYPRDWALDRRWACRRCTARRGITEPVEIGRSCHAPVCRRHRLWLVSPSWSIKYSGVPPGASLDLLRVTPEIWSAQRRHARLARNAAHADHVGNNAADAVGAAGGDTAAGRLVRALKEARWVLWRWGARGDWPEHRLRRLHLWGDPSGHEFGRDHPLFEMANYPEVVALTGLLADPHRRWPQPGDGEAGLTRVVIAVRHALNIAYTPYHAREPLLEVIEQRAREQRWHDRDLL